MGEPTQGLFKVDGPKSVESQFEIPSEVSVGVKLGLSERLKFFSDLNSQFATKYHDGNLLSDEYEYGAPLRVNSGIQFKVSDKNHVLAGSAFNPSIIKKTLGEAQEKYFVGSFGIQTQNENSIFGLGLFVGQSYGEMESNKVSTTFQNTETYKSTVITSVTGLLMGSGFAF